MRRSHQRPVPQLHWAGCHTTWNWGHKFLKMNRCWFATRRAPWPIYEMEAGCRGIDHSREDECTGTHRNEGHDKMATTRWERSGSEEIKVLGKETFDCRPVAASRSRPESMRDQCMKLNPHIPHIGVAKAMSSFLLFLWSPRENQSINQIKSTVAQLSYIFCPRTFISKAFS